MSTAEDTLNTSESVKPRQSVLDRVVGFLSSVRFGVVLLCILVVLSMIGMIIIQQNVQGFDAYFASLTPAERMVYGYLGLFDIYHSWYFNVLLLVLSLNIVLASIDRFPTAWAYIVKPKTTATRDWLLDQKVNDTITLEADSEDAAAERVRNAFSEFGLKPAVTKAETREYALNADGRKDFSRMVTRSTTTVFGERGKWNRIGAYIVHVSLLTLFLGHFIANVTGFDADVRMIPGDTSDKIQMIQLDLDKREKYDVQLPFSVACTDIEQKLIDPRGNIGVQNTMDWRTELRIDDREYGTTVANVSMNNPFSYRGYRFFQAEASRIGSARSIELELTSQATGETQKLTIPRLGNATLPDGTFVEYDEFLPDFTFNQDGNPDTRSGDYNNPAAVLSVTPVNGERQRVFAFESGKADNIPVGAPKAGYKWRISNYEKVPFAHVLSIKYDPYSGAFIAWYFGGFGLMFALCYVFFFSHKRVWALVEPMGERLYTVTIGGHANRNHAAFEDKFKRITAGLKGTADDHAERGN
jgi:cytochrome c biogenesis protein